MAYGLKGKRSFAVLNAMKQTTTLTKSDGTFASDRAAYNKVVINKAGNVTISNSGYVTAMRGEANIAAGSTLKDGFIYGSQGKVICPGAVAQTSALRLCGVQAALDCGGSTITAGQLSALWADVSGADPSSNWNEETNVIRATNSTGKDVHSFMFSYGKASYMFDLNCSTTGVVATAGGDVADAAKTASRVIKIFLNGTDGYIPVYDANA